jgi:predicted nucleic acid-binding Zn ribbon protein
MQRSNTHSVGELIAELFRETGLEKPLMERRIVEAWPEVLGSTVSRYTGDIKILNGVLFVHIKSAPLRQELFNCRFQLVEKLQQAVGCEGVIKDIRLLG